MLQRKSQQQYDRSGQQLFAAIGKNVVLGQHSDDEQVRRNGHFDRSTAQRDEIFGEESPVFSLGFSWGVGFMLLQCLDRFSYI
ncbi:hypothetical protein [Alistipes indistinctus]|uniref:hypothetical protein n=1 Tax=Alistipes indistinctus TaxID=626932 RepID=UPI003522FC80